LNQIPPAKADKRGSASNRTDASPAAEGANPYKYRGFSQSSLMAVMKRMVKALPMDSPLLRSGRRFNCGQSV